MPANRCSQCGVNWPVAATYEKCPQCDSKADYIHNAVALEFSEAKRLKAHAEFKAWLERETPRAARLRRLKWHRKRQAEIRELESMLTAGTEDHAGKTEETH